MIKILFRTLSILICPLLLVSCVSQLELGNTFYANGQYDQAAAQWNPVAYAGNPYAQYNLALLWESGLGSTPKNLNEAANWYLKSAQQGYVDAMVRLANIQTELGHTEAAVSWLNLAARWGNLSAQNELRKQSLPVPADDLRQSSIVAQQRNSQATVDAVMGLIYSSATANSNAGYSAYTPPTYSTYKPPSYSTTSPPSSNSSSAVQTEEFIHGNSGTSYQRIGNATFGSDGTTRQKIGSTTFDSDGGTSQRIGNSTFNSDGSTTQQIGDTLFNSDGSTVQRIGNSTFGSDGTTCQKIGSQTICN
jgi:hypothetical protein